MLFSMSCLATKINYAEKLYFLKVDGFRPFREEVSRNSALREATILKFLENTPVCWGLKLSYGEIIIGKRALISDRFGSVFCTCCVVFCIAQEWISNQLKAIGR